MSAPHLITLLPSFFIPVLPHPQYKPQSMDDVLGGQETAKLLLSWLRDWDAVHLHKTKKVAFTQSGPSCKAVLLSGPPGIGKTTMATLAAKTLQYECLELNASDTRGKKAIEQQLADVVLSRALAADGMRTLKRLVIMDEVDGMGGSDRGGIPELIKVIKASKSPIVCICNDRQAQKIRTLVRPPSPARTHTPARPHARTHARTHAHTHTHDVCRFFSPPRSSTTSRRPATATTCA